MNRVAEAKHGADARKDSSGHITALDGLRGLAALIVVVAHSAYLYVDSAQSHGVLRGALSATYRAAHPAVILFFTLSGFVLYRAFSKQREIGLAPYLLRRTLRIYPALAFAVLASF